MIVANHEGDLIAYVASIRGSHLHSDLTIHCLNGKIISHRCILSRTSPFLKSLLLEMDEPHLVLPDVTLHIMKILLTLLHSGPANVQQMYVQIGVLSNNCLNLP